MVRCRPIKKLIVSIGIWLTACTYPIVVLVLPIVVEIPFGRVAYLTVAETFAPAAECLLFYYAFNRNSDNTRKGNARDVMAIVAANLLSFAPIEIMSAMGWIDWKFLTQ